MATDQQSVSDGSATQDGRHPRSPIDCGGVSWRDTHECLADGVQPRDPGRVGGRPSRMKSNRVDPPAAIVDRQVRAYNARDIDAWCAACAPDVVIARLNGGQEMARGID